MSKFKKVLCTVLACGMALSATACGGEVVEQTPNDKPTILVQYYLAGYGEDWMNAIRDRFNEKAKAGEYDFYVKVFGDPELGVSLSNALQYGGSNLPDVAYVNSINPIQDLMLGNDRYADLSDVYESTLTINGKQTTLNEVMDDVMLSRNTVNGKIPTITTNVGVFGYVYNKALFEEYDLEIPKTMAEMKTLLDTIDGLSVNNDLNKNNDLYGVVYPSATIGYWDNILYTHMAQYLGREGFFDVLECDYGVDTVASELETVRHAYENSLANMQTFNVVDHDFSLKTATTHTNALTAFAQGNCFMTICGEWTYNELKPIASNIAENIGMIPVPLACDENGLVNAKATPSTEVTAANENMYTKIERAKVAPSVIPQTDLNSEYIYFKNYTSSNAGEVNWIIPAKDKNVDYGKQFLKFVFSDEGLKLQSEYNYFCHSLLKGYEIDNAIYENMPSFAKDCTAAIRNSEAIFINKYTTKARTYSIVSEFMGADPDFRLQLLKSNNKELPKIQTDKIFATLVDVTKDKEAQVAAFELANKKQNG